jgi:hypothetical protein
MYLMKYNQVSYFVTVEISWIYRFNTEEFRENLSTYILYFDYRIKEGGFYVF